MKRKILITGAAGRIGRLLTTQLADRYDLVLTDRHAPDPRPPHPFHVADLTDVAALAPVFPGVDTIVHLGANPSPEAEWEGLVGPNILGVRHVFEGASAWRCRRVIFASSIHAVDGHPSGAPLPSSIAARPKNAYGATKAFGEALASVYAARGDWSAICLRIGWLIDDDAQWPELVKQAARFVDLAFTHRDAVAAFVAAIEAPDELRYGVFNVTSANSGSPRLDLSETRRALGYAPQDDLVALARGQGT